jgi:hypothetical protein
MKPELWLNLLSEAQLLLPFVTGKTLRLTKKNDFERMVGIKLLYRLK